MPSDAPTPAEIAAAHQSYEWAGGVCCICGPDYYTNAAEHGAHVIAALSEHYHLLPKAEPGGEDDDRAEWLDGEVMAARGKRVVRLYFEDPRNTPEDARELASALASAADVAEEPR